MAVFLCFQGFPESLPLDEVAIGMEESCWSWSMPEFVGRSLSEYARLMVLAWVGLLEREAPVENGNTARDNTSLYCITTGPSSFPRGAAKSTCLRYVQSLEGVPD